jgi:hypothetical protein
MTHCSMNSSFSSPSFSPIPSSSSCSASSSSLIDSFFLCSSSSSSISPPVQPNNFKSKFPSGAPPPSSFGQANNENSNTLISSVFSRSFPHSSVSSFSTRISSHNSSPDSLLFPPPVVHGPGVSDHQAEKVLSPDYWNLRIAKLDSQQPVKEIFLSTIHSPVNFITSPLIFTGLVFYLSGRLDISYSQIQFANLIKTLGGRILPFLSLQQVSHVLIENSSLSKTLQMIKRRENLNNREVHFISPRWVLNSIEAGMKLPVEQFLLWKPKQSVKSFFQQTDKGEHETQRENKRRRQQTEEVQSKKKQADQKSGGTVDCKSMI